MISGAHVILYSVDAEADREFLRTLLGTRTVDAGDGWTIIALPPAEIAVHPTGGAPKHEVYLMTDDLDATVADLTARGVEFVGGISDQGWGLLTAVRLPSGAAVGLYQPRHPVAHGHGHDHVPAPGEPTVPELEEDENIAPRPEEEIADVLRAEPDVSDHSTHRD